LVERAARLTLVDPTGSRLERIIGGRVTQRLRAHIATPLTEDKAARLLNAVKSAAEQHGEGESSSSGVTWHSVGEGSPILVSAHAEGGGTHVRVMHDRRAGLVTTGALTGFGVLAAGFLVLLVGEASGLQSLPIGLSLIGGAVASALAVGRAAWVSSSRRSHGRVVALMDAASRSLEETSTDSVSSARNTPETPA
jgi:hypothetical protein